MTQTAVYHVTDADLADLEQEELDRRHGYDGDALVPCVACGETMVSKRHDARDEICTTCRREARDFVETRERRAFYQRLANQQYEERAERRAA